MCLIFRVVEGVSVELGADSRALDFLLGAVLRSGWGSRCCASTTKAVHTTRFSSSRIACRPLSSVQCILATPHPIASMIETPRRTRTTMRAPQWKSVWLFTADDRSEPLAQATHCPLRPEAGDEAPQCHHYMTSGLPRRPRFNASAHIRESPLDSFSRLES